MESPPNHCTTNFDERGKLYFLFSQSVFNFENMKYEVSGGNRFEIPRCARNDGVVYETGNAAAVNAEPLFCPCAAATLESGQRVIPSIARNLEQGGENVPCCLRGAMSAGGADALVRWDSCPTKVNRYKIRFLESFYIQEKKYEKNI